MRSIETAYDARNYVTAVNAGGSITSQLRDALGNLAQETDPNNTASGNAVNTTYQYDALHRLLGVIDRLDGSASYAYDVNGKPTQVTAPNGLATAYVYDDLGNLLQETSPQRGVLSYTYDAAGNVLSQSDATGNTITYTYDALNRLTSLTAPATSDNVTYVYDTCTLGVGRLCRVVDGSGTTRYTYDAFGNIATESKDELGVTYTTQYAYDAGNRVTGITYPDGRLITYTRDGIGRITAVTATVNGAAQTIVSNRTYRADGLVTAQTFGNGLGETRAYDAKGQLTSQALGGLVNQSYGYDYNGNPTAIGSNTQSYDLLDRLEQANWSGGSDAYTYEANGDVLLTSQPLPASPAEEGFAYTSLGQLAAYSQNNSTVASYTYNFLRQRTQKAAAATTVYHYDLSGNLIQETDNSGNPIRTYVWADQAPIAQIDTSAASDTLTYLHTDQLNTPRWGTNAAGTLVCEWSGEPFGATPPNEDPGQTGHPVTVNLRTPGQYYDAESGLFYNWNRYYDPRIGRYIGSDPIGLKGGLNTYVYVQNNPFRWIDAVGLATKPLPTPAPEPIYPPPPPGTNIPRKKPDPDVCANNPLLPSQPACDACCNATFRHPHVLVQCHASCAWKFAQNQPNQCMVSRN